MNKPKAVEPPQAFYDFCLGFYDDTLFGGDDPDAWMAGKVAKLTSHQKQILKGFFESLLASNLTGDEKMPVWKAE